MMPIIAGFVLNGMNQHATIPIANSAKIDQINHNSIEIDMPKKMVGRPVKYDLEEIAKDMLEWSLEDNAMSLLDFTFDKEYCADDLPKWSKEDPQFSLTFKKVKERIAKRREDAINRGEMEKGVHHRIQGFYYNTLRDYEREEKELDAALALKKKEQEDADYISKLGDYVEGKSSSDNK
jgi:hypothetical protein